MRMAGIKAADPHFLVCINKREKSRRLPGQREASGLYPILEIYMRCPYSFKILWMRSVGF